MTNRLVPGDKWYDPELEDMRDVVTAHSKVNSIPCTHYLLASALAKVTGIVTATTLNDYIQRAIENGFLGGGVSNYSLTEKGGRLLAGKEILDPDKEIQDLKNRISLLAEVLAAHLIFHTNEEWK
jgi:hypothetical protein